MSNTCILIGAPVFEGAGRRGCDLGAGAFRAAGLGETLTSLDFNVIDNGNLAATQVEGRRHPNAAVRDLAAVAAWVETIEREAYAAAGHGTPIFLGGDHSLSAGSI